MTCRPLTTEDSARIQLNAYLLYHYGDACSVGRCRRDEDTRSWVAEVTVHRGELLVPLATIRIDDGRNVTSPPERSLLEKRAQTVADEPQIAERLSREIESGQTVEDAWTGIAPSAYVEQERAEGGPEPGRSLHELEMGSKRGEILFYTDLVGTDERAAALRRARLAPYRAEDMPVVNLSRGAVPSLIPFDSSCDFDHHVILDVRNREIPDVICDLGLADALQSKRTLVSLWTLSGPGRDRPTWMGPDPTLVHHRILDVGLPGPFDKAADQNLALAAASLVRVSRSGSSSWEEQRIQLVVVGWKPAEVPGALMEDKDLPLAWASGRPGDKRILVSEQDYRPSMGTLSLFAFGIFDVARISCVQSVMTSSGTELTLERPSLHADAGPPVAEPAIKPGRYAVAADLARAGDFDFWSAGLVRKEKELRVLLRRLGGAGRRPLVRVQVASDATYSSLQFEQWVSFLPTLERGDFLYSTPIDPNEIPNWTEEEHPDIHVALQFR